MQKIRLAEAIANLKNEQAEFRKDMKSVQNLMKRKNQLLEKLLELTKKRQEIVSPKRKSVKREKAVETTKYFPIMSRKELDEFENLDFSNETMRNEIIQDARKRIKSRGLVKSLHKILNDKLVTFYNLEGTQNLMRLFDYPNFMDILFRAVEDDGTTHEQYIVDLRNAIKVIKSRINYPR